MPLKRKRIVLTIWQWDSGEVTAFLDELDIGGEGLELEQPRLVAQGKVGKGAAPSEVLRFLSETWGRSPVR